jgi:thiamine pyrophosphate-dependent acetolactate synthase large subunit-like protein
MLQRPDGLRLIAERFPDAPIILTLGGTLREMLAVAGRRPNHLPILDAMGQPAAIGLGLALGLADATQHDRVIVVEGDGSLLMGLSSIATIGHVRPDNLMVIVFDNAVYLATGGQPTATADADFAAIARACGWPSAKDVDGEADAFADALSWAEKQPGPVLLRVRVGVESIPTDFFLEDPAILAHDFMTWLGGQRGEARPQG